MPTEVVQQVYTGKLKPDVLTLAMTLDQYEAYKSDTPKAAREIGQRIERLRTDMKSVFGKQKLKYTPLTDITRQDANDLRDHLLSRVSANSAVRMLGVVRTAINHVIVEHSLTIPNVFTNLKIKGAGASKHDRLPLTDSQLTLLEPAFSGDAIAWALYVTLRDTGARVSEISGLRVKDCDLVAKCLHISPTPWRGLKTTNSQRSVPLSAEAAAALAKLARDKDPEAPLFPNYAKDRGADSCSAMLMKRLRRSIADRKLTMHSLRHRMKDKLQQHRLPRGRIPGHPGAQHQHSRCQLRFRLCLGGHAEAFGESVVKWTSGKSERTLNQSAANGRKEPTLTDAAICFNGCKVQIGIILRPNC